MTPYVDPQPGVQERYNRAHCQTRVKVEQMFGMLKNRFYCLKGLRMRPDRSVKAIASCVVLHNIAMERGDIVEAQVVVEVDQYAPNFNGFDDGRLLRDHIANHAFV